MTNATPQHRPRRSTRYVIVASHPDHPSVIVGFTPRLSRVGLLNALRSRGEEIIEHCQINESNQITFHTRPRVHAKVGNGWTIGFTGETEYQLFQSV